MQKPEIVHLFVGKKRRDVFLAAIFFKFESEGHYI